MNLPKEFLEEMKNVPRYEEFLHSYEQPPSRAFKINDTKISDTKFLENFGYCEEVLFADHCYYLNEGKWGNHPFHKAGLMYFQEPSAMTPINAYDIDADFALDLCAAPGGKSVQLAGKVGSLVSNDITPSRASVLWGNVERMGYRNVAVTCNSPMDFERLGEVFDLVVVDAPCSGEGMFRRDENAIAEWSVEHSVSCAARQKAILESADKVLKKGGILIYSTCTFSARENEHVVEHFLNLHDYELLPVKKEVEDCTSFLTDKRMRRFYPHIARGEGQFFAGLRKKCGGEKRLKPVRTAKNKIVSEFLHGCIGMDLKYGSYGDKYYVPAIPYELPLRYVSGGVQLGRLSGKIFKPDHSLFSSYGNIMNSVELSYDEAVKYLRGEELCGNLSGYGAVTILGGALGGVKGSNGTLKNLFPKGLRVQ